MHFRDDLHSWPSSLQPSGFLEVCSKVVSLLGRKFRSSLKKGSSGPALRERTAAGPRSWRGRRERRCRSGPWPPPKGHQSKTSSGAPKKEEGSGSPGSPARLPRGDAAEEHEARHLGCLGPLVETRSSCHLEQAYTLYFASGKPNIS